ncbi:cytochrome c [uncultured Sulfitobacter sp.]|uniref:c-type cytochrome n=1 Tax=uncultured Sulfitobacter sp. TaxID=191468 RepID=UPI00261CA56D|nr:cytochrome c [uncultured Sulfitobacter sp.]
MLIRSLALTTTCIALFAGCATLSNDQREAIKRGQGIYVKECAQCHGPTGAGGGEASLGLGETPPDLTRLSERNDGVFPREFVRRFVLGLIDKTNPDAAMPEFAKVGLAHVYPKGGADGEVLEADFADLLEYLESIQK